MASEPNDSGEEKEEITDEKDNLTFDRRAYVKFLGAGITTGVGLSAAGSAAGNTTQEGISFDRVVNAVDDLRMDPNGNAPIDPKLRNGLESGTLIEFPEGEYFIDDGVTEIGSLERWGIRGLGDSHRDVKFVAESDESGSPTMPWLNIQTGGSGGPFLLENFSLQQPYDGSTGIGIIIREPGGSVLKDLEWLGKSPPDYNFSPSIALLTVDATSTSGVSRVENVTVGVDEPAVKPGYPDGVQFLRNGGAHNGELIVRDCRFEEQGSNVTRSTVCEGVMTIRNCVFRNNDNTNLRFGAGNHPTKVGSAKNCRIVLEEGVNEVGDAIRLDSSPNSYGGAVLEDTEVIVESGADVNRAAIAFPGFADHGSATFRNVTVKNDDDGLPSLFAESCSTSDDEIVLENCHFVGSGDGITVKDRDGSVVRDSCFDMPNGSISGMETKNVSSSCSNTLEFRGTGTVTNYEVVVTEEIQPHPDADDIESWDDVSGDTANGYVTEPEHVDTYQVSGEIESLEFLEGEATVTLDGEEIDPSSF